MVKLHQILAEAVAAGQLGEGNYSLPQMGPAIEKLEALVRFVNQVVSHIGFSFLSIDVLSFKVISINFMSYAPVKDCE